MTDRLRNVIADVLVGLVLVIVAYWLLRGVFGVIIWAARVAILAIVVVFALRVASKLRT